MGDVGDQIRLQPFALHLFLEHVLHAVGNVVQVLRQILFFPREQGGVDLVAGIAGGQIVNGLRDLVHLPGAVEHVVKAPQVQHDEDNAEQDPHNVFQRPMSVVERQVHAG